MTGVWLILGNNIFHKVIQLNFLEIAANLADISACVPPGH